MISTWFSLFLIPLGALLFRIRGGWLELGSSTLGRVTWAGGMTVIPTLVSWKLSVVAPALFLGAVLGWWKSIDMGRNEGSFAMDALLQTARGVLWVLPAAAASFWALGFWALLLLVPGLLCGALYELGWRTQSSVEGFSRGSELGELYFGAAIGLFFALSIIGGLW